MYRKIMVLISMAIFLGSSSIYATDAGFSVSATLLQAVAVTKNVDLTFGTIDIPSTGSTGYTVNANTGPHSAGQTAAAAQFDVTAANGFVADVSIVEVNPVVGGDGSGNFINFTLNVSTATISGLGATIIPVYVGGSVTIASSDVAGTYTATATLRVLYQ